MASARPKTRPTSSLVIACIVLLLLVLLAGLIVYAVRATTSMASVVYVVPTPPSHSPSPRSSPPRPPRVVGDDDEDEDGDEDEEGHRARGCRSPRKGRQGRPQPQPVVVAMDQNSVAPPEVYQQIGFLRVGDEANGGPTAPLLPLYGQRSVSRRNRSYYYTITSGIKVPLVAGGRSCLDEVGCDELFQGDVVTVPDVGVVATVVLYKYPRS